MICALCYSVLRGHQGAQWRGTWDLHFEHHVDRKKLVGSANMSCCICRSILREITNLEEKEEEKERERETEKYAHKVNQQGIKPVDEEIARTTEEIELTTQEIVKPNAEEDFGGQGPLFTLFAFIQILIHSLLRIQGKTNGEQSQSADQTIIHEDELENDFGNYKNRSILEKPRSLVTAYLSELNDKNYRLDFKWRDTENVGTFILHKTDGSDTRRFHTPFSHTTKSDEVLQQAKKWIEICRSKGESGHLECPGESGERSFYPTRLIDLGVKSPKTGQWPEEVRLIETAKVHPEDYYVTLSHCWGDAKFQRLLPDNENKLLRDGIDVKELPKTFRHAIKFARKLGSVPTFRPRPDLTIPLPTVRYIWIDSLCIMQGNSIDARNDWLRESATMYEIYNKAYCNLSATASPSSDGGLFRKREPHTLWEDEINLNVKGIPVDPRKGTQPSIQRCVIQDLSFWARTIDEAPVNRRGWVLQERMMAPRVIHFCENQIAWECSHLEAAESAQDGVPSLHILPGIKPATDSVPPVGPEVPSKQRRGSHSAHARMADPDSVEHWQTVVERYSRTKLTKAEDKLIALSGYARMKSEELPDSCTYLAGMWIHHLESQLLWRVNPVFTNGEFEYPSSRPDRYRAPTWSWAAVDAPQGITCGTITEGGLYIEVQNPAVELEMPGNKFGLVKDGQLELLGILKQIELNKLETNSAVRYSWNLTSTEGRGNSTTHSIVYLDSPSSDADILGSHGRMYCMPARTDSDGYLICLLLQLEHEKAGKETRKYRRVGLTKVSPYEGDDAIKIICEPSGDEMYIPWSDWGEKRQTHRICVV